MKKILNFFKESFAELKKVSWPKKDDITGSTVVAIIFILIAAVFLGAIDIGFSQLILIIFS